MNAGPHGQGRSVLWNRTVCGTHLESQGYEPMSRSLLVDQWTRLLEALELGSPSINATADQMAEDMPKHLVAAVNARLQLLGCGFQVSQFKTVAQGSSGSRTAAT